MRGGDSNRGERSDGGLEDGHPGEVPSDGEMMAGRQPARFTHMSGVYRTAVWSPRRPKSRGDCQTFTEDKGSAVVRVIKEHTAGFSIITEGLTLELGFLVAMVGERERVARGSRWGCNISEISALNESGTRRQRNRPRGLSLRWLSLNRFLF